MPLKRTRIIVAALIAAGLGLLASHEWLMPDPHAVVVRFFDAGAGGSTLITGPGGERIVIDGGSDFTALEDLGMSMPFFDRSISLLVLTVPYADHLGSLPDILRRYNVGRVLLTGVADTNGRYEEFLATLAAQKIPVTLAQSGSVIRFGDGLALTVLSPQQSLLGKNVSPLRDSSMMLLLSYGSSATLFAGDAPATIETAVQKQVGRRTVDLLQIGNNGGASNGTGFLLAIHPVLAVIPAANTPKGLAGRLRALRIPYRTEASGTTIVRLSGSPNGIQITN